MDARSIERGLFVLMLCAGLSPVACNAGSDGSADPGRTLSAKVNLPNEGSELDDPPIDETVEVSGMSDSGGPSVVEPGDILVVRLAFVAPNGNVGGAGIRFGEDGPIRTVDIPDAMGVTEGTLEFQVEVPPDICDSIARICHDVRCYEFAVTDAGAISAANINDIGLVCGGCDVPSCEGLLDCDQAATGTGDTGMMDGNDDSTVPECTADSDCGFKYGDAGQRVCRSGECADCMEDADCGSGRLCVGGGCFTENCSAVTVIPAEEMDAACMCPDPGVPCSADGCSGLCYGGLCKQDCHATADENLCTTICPEGTWCSPSLGYCSF